MSLTGQGLAEYAESLLGTPYFYGSKIPYGVLTESFMMSMHSYYPSTVSANYMDKARRQGQVGKINVDCSGVIGAYRKKNIGSSQLYQTAYTRMPVSKWSEWGVGVVTWKEGHVGVYVGNGNVVEARGIDYGTVKTRITDRPWKYGLTFSDIDYSYSNKIDGTWKGSNPYQEPNILIRRGSRGEFAKWVQWELCQAGYAQAIEQSGGIDGVVGTVTDACIRAFQKSCKITCDGIVGNVTRSYLKAN